MPRWNQSEAHRHRHTSPPSTYHHPRSSAHNAITPKSSHTHHNLRLVLGKRAVNGPTLCPRREEPHLHDSSSVVAGCTTEESSQFTLHITHHLTHRDRHHSTASLQLALVTSHAASARVPQRTLFGAHRTDQHTATSHHHNHVPPPRTRTAPPQSRHVPLLVSRTTSPRVRGCHTHSRPLLRERAHPTHPGCRHDLSRCTPGRLTHHLLSQSRTGGTTSRSSHKATATATREEGTLKPVQGASRTPSEHTRTTPYLLSTH